MPDVDPAGSARVIGFPVKVRKLGPGLEDPDGFCSTLGLAIEPDPDDRRVHS